MLEVCVAQVALQQRVRRRLCGVATSASGVCGVELGRAIPTLTPTAPARQRGPTPTAVACTRNCATVRSACTRGMMTRSCVPRMSTAPSSRGTPYLRGKHRGQVGWQVLAPIWTPGGGKDGFRTHSCTPTPDPTNPMTAPQIRQRGALVPRVVAHDELHRTVGLQVAAESRPFEAGRQCARWLQRVHPLGCFTLRRCCTVVGGQRGQPSRVR